MSATGENHSVRTISPQRERSLVRPCISVVIPVWNDSTGLIQCLSALESQSYDRDRYEVIVVDNGSTDFSATEVLRRFPDTVVLREAVASSYAARNAGVRAARGEFLAFTDSDCVPTQDWLTAAAECLRLMPGRTLLAGRIERERSHRPSVFELYDVLFFLTQDSYVTRRHFATTANLFVPRVAFDVAGLFVDKLRSGGDYEWTRRAQLRGFELHYVPHVSVRHPTLRTLRSLIVKSRRIAGGRSELARMSGGSTRQLLKQAWTELLDIAPRLGLIRCSHAVAGYRQRGGVAIVAVVLQCVRALEALRLMLGRKTRRR